MPKSPISPAENSAFSRDSVGPWRGGGEEMGRGEEDKIERNLKKKSNLITLVHCWRPLKSSKLLAAFVSAAVLSAANKL